MSRKTLLVDFDGVLHSYTSGWQGASLVSDPPVDGAIEWLIKMVQWYDVAIYSSRSQASGGIRAMRTALARWAASAGLTPGEVHTFLSALLFPTHKGPAWLTIDDRCFLFQGRFPTEEEIDSFKPWNKGG